MVNKVRLGGLKTPDRPSSAPRTGKQRRVVQGTRDKLPRRNFMKGNTQGPKQVQSGLENVPNFWPSAQPRP